MKNSILKVVLVMVLCVCVFGACGKKSGLSGIYELSSGKTGDVEVTKDQMASLGMGNANIEFTSDKDVKMSLGDQISEGTYTVDGDKVSIKLDDETENATLDGDKLTFEMEGMSLVFIKK